MKLAPSDTGIACCDGWIRFVPKCKPDILLLHRALLTTDLVKLDWAAVETHLQPYRRHPGRNYRRPRLCSKSSCAGFSKSHARYRRGGACLVCAWAAIDRYRRARGISLAAPPGHRGRRIALRTRRHPPSNRFPIALFLLVRSALSGAPNEGAYGAALTVSSSLSTG